MSAAILDGRQLAGRLETPLRRVIQMSGKRPHLSVILVGDQSASATYVRNKLRACQRVGIDCRVHRLSADISQRSLVELVEHLNSMVDVDAILVQLPLPSTLNAEELLSRIDPNKDVDGLTPLNRGRLLGGDRGAMIPPTALGIQWLLMRGQVPLADSRAVIIGRSSIVGRPLSILLSHKSFGGDATVTLAHSATGRLADLCKGADVLISAMGRAELVDASYLKPGGVVIDVGIHQTSRGLVGDVVAEDAARIARLRSPVPGGVGPLTVHCLLYNVARAAGCEGFEDHQRAILL